MRKVIDVVIGILAGSAVLALLSYLIAPLPIIGWIIAAGIAGYVASRLGDQWSGFIVALASPEISLYEARIFLIDAARMSDFSGISALGSLYSLIINQFGRSMIVYVTLANLINVTSIGFGTLIGSLSYIRSKSKARRSSKEGLVAIGPSMNQPATLTAPSGHVPPASSGVPSATPASTTPTPKVEGAQQLRSSVLRLIQTYNNVRADPKDKPFRNQVYVSLISSMAREVEELTKSWLRSQPDEQRATSAGLLKNTLIEEFRRRYPNLETPSIGDPVARSLLDSVKEAIYRGILNGNVYSYGASTPDEVNGLAALLASDVLMKSLESWLSKVGS